MLGVAGRVRDFSDLAVAVVGPCFTRSHCRPEIVENMGMKTDALARFKAEMPYPHAFSLRHESSSNVPVAGVRDEILTELRCPALGRLWPSTGRVPNRHLRNGSRRIFAKPLRCSDSPRIVAALGTVSKRHCIRGVGGRLHKWRDSRGVDILALRSGGEMKISDIDRDREGSL
jgi:hypothetical protein